MHNANGTGQCAKNKNRQVCMVYGERASESQEMGLFRGRNAFCVRGGSEFTETHRPTKMHHYSYSEYRSNWPAATSIPTLTSGGALLGASSLRMARERKLARIRQRLSILNPFRRKPQLTEW